MKPAPQMMMPIGTGGGIVGGVAPTVPIDSTATSSTVPGTAVFGAGPIVDSSVTTDDSVNDDSMAAADSLKEMFLAGAAEQVTEEVPDKE